jgi:predicted nicotinamide N-methyase
MAPLRSRAFAEPFDMTRTARDRYTAHGVRLLGMTHPRIRALKRDHAPSVHGHRPWTSSFLMMDYLERHPMPKGARVMEIGCGWGPVSIFCAKRFAARVTGVDIDRDVFPYLRALAAENDVRIRTVRSPFERLTVRHLGRQDVIVGSDICFWDELVDPLFNLIRRAGRGGAHRFVLADPGRSPFRTLTERCEAAFAAQVWEWDTGRPEKVEGEILDIVF